MSKTNQYVQLNTVREALEQNGVEQDTIEEILKSLSEETLLSTSKIQGFSISAIIFSGFVINYGLK